MNQIKSYFLENEWADFKKWHVKIKGLKGFFWNLQFRYIFVVESFKITPCIKFILWVTGVLSSYINRVIHKLAGWYLWMVSKQIDENRCFWWFHRNYTCKNKYEKSLKFTMKLFHSYNKIFSKTCLFKRRTKQYNIKIWLSIGCIAVLPTGLT